MQGEKRALQKKITEMKEKQRCVCVLVCVLMCRKVIDDESHVTVFAGRKTYKTPRQLSEHVVRWTSMNSKQR